MDKGFLGASKFSVSKITIALSDFVTLIWIFIIIYTLSILNHSFIIYGLIIIILTFSYGIMIFKRTYSKSENIIKK
jgi:hypothetical protein